MAGMIAVQVIVELKIPVALAAFPVQWRGYSMVECSIVDNRKIEAVAVPTDQDGSEFFNSIEESLEQFPL